MESLKKTIKQAITTGITENCTGGTCYVIIPDLSAVYNFNVCLKQKNKDWGFFDTYFTGETNNFTGETFQPILVTGTSRSLLSELKKYGNYSNFFDRYKLSATPLNDGVDKYQSNYPTKIVYYVGGIKYIDSIIDDTTVTIFSFEKNNINPEDFINVPIYKDPNKEGIISNPKIDSDVFIIRQQISAFNDNYDLEFIENLNDLTYYAGGNYFNVVNNI